MPRLILPSAELHGSFLEAMDEFAAEGRGTADDHSGIGRDLRAYLARWRDPGFFDRYVRALLAAAREETPRPDGIVPQTTLWYVDADTYLGRLAIRHRLTPHLLEVGGHIGYDIRPSGRRRGHATRMLAEALPYARELGIDDVLITCDNDNIASERVIRANGGEPGWQGGRARGVLGDDAAAPEANDEPSATISDGEDRGGAKLRFWIRRNSPRSPATEIGCG